MINLSLVKAHRNIVGVKDATGKIERVSEQRITCGKDFVQLKNGPFDLDLVFAPDGIEHFADAWRRRIEVEGFSVCHPDDIIASKEASGRAKDLESLPRLRSFREYWLRQHGRS